MPKPPCNHPKDCNFPSCKCGETIIDRFKRQYENGQVVYFELAEKIKVATDKTKLLKKLDQQAKVNRGLDSLIRG